MSAITVISLVVLAVDVIALIFWYMKIKAMQLRHARMLAELEHLHEAQREEVAQWAQTTTEEIYKSPNSTQNNSQELEEPNWFLNYYKCSNCDREWTDEWSAKSDDNCPKCDTIMSPRKSEDIG